MAVLYVDESGEEGFAKTSSEWLILGGVLQPSHVRKNIITEYDTFKNDHCQNNWHFHFQKASHDMTLGFINAMCRTDIRAVAVAIHKPSITSQSNFSKKYYLYFYALRLLLERATVWSRDHCKEELYLYLSARRGLTTKDFENYLTRVETSPFTSRDGMAWSHLKRQEFEIRDNKELRGLQFADCVASALGKAIEKSQYGTHEDRYIKKLHKCFHQDSLTYRTAVKIWPQPKPSPLFQDRFEWMHPQPPQKK